MKKVTILLPLLLIAVCLFGCTSQQPQIAATTLPVYEFTQWLCQDTDITVGLLVNENVSCLHDYTLQVSQMRMLEAADAVVISGAGLEDFLGDVLQDSHIVIDASVGTHIHGSDHDHHEEHGHNHETDPHIWLSPENAMGMARNICDGLSALYPNESTRFECNLQSLLTQLQTLEDHGRQTLSALSCREIITFHDGFAYFAEAFDLTILRAVEEESGSEASAAELKELIGMVEAHALPAIFTEKNGSVSAADVIAAETGVRTCVLDMAMSGNSYFDAMYHNIETVKEALG